MKKLFVFLLASVVVLSLSACDYIEGIDDEVIDKIVDCVENPEDESCQDLVDEIIDPEDDRTIEEIAIDTIIEAYEANPDLTFLSVALQQLDFTSAVGEITELSLEVVDSEGIHTLQYRIEDKMMDLDGLPVVQRKLLMDVDGEIVLDQEVFYETIETGVRVYVKLDMYLPEMEDADLEMLEVLGFDQPYAMFEFSDSLENVIEVEVMKDILLTAYFNEVGEDVFVELQNELEIALQLDLDEYNINLDLFFDTLVVEEDEEAFNELIDAVLIEDLQFDLDQMFVVPELIALLNQFDEIDGTVDGVVGTTIIIAVAEADLLENGSEAFLNSLTEEQQIDFRENVLLPYMQSQYAVMFEEDFIDVDSLQTDLDAFLLDNEADLLMYGIDAATLSAELNEVGIVEFMVNLDEMTLMSLENVAWFADYYMYPYGDFAPNQELLDECADLAELEDDIVSFLTAHYDLLVAAGLDVDAMLEEIDTMGAVYFVNNISEEDVSVIIEAIVTPIMESYEAFIESDEKIEEIIEMIFSNPEVEMALMEIPGLDAAALTDAFLALDADALALEMIDAAELVQAVRGGQMSFDAFLDANEDSAPYAVSLLRPFSMSVMYLEAYQPFVDEIEYALTNLDTFSKYLEPDYYMNDDMIVTDLTRTEDSTLHVELDMPSSSLIQVLDDFTADLNDYLSGFSMVSLQTNNANLECISDFCMIDFPYTEIHTMLDSVNVPSVELEYDPVYMNQMEMSIDLTELASTLSVLLNTPVDGEMYNPEDMVMITSLLVNVTMTNDVSIELPTEYNDTNELIVEAAKLTLIEEAKELLNAVAEYDAFYMSAVEGERPLSDFDYDVSLNPVFDAELSTVTFDGSDYELDLVWVDGTDVFGQTVDLLDLSLEMNSNENYLSLVGLVEEDNYNVTKLFMYYFMD